MFCHLSSPHRFWLIASLGFEAPDHQRSREPRTLTSTAPTGKLLFSGHAEALLPGGRPSFSCYCISQTGYTDGFIYVDLGGLRVVPL